MAMTAAIEHKPKALPPIQGLAIASYIFIGVPLLLVAICFAAKVGYLEIAPGPRAGLIFVLLIALMLTGMPISIALGLTVLIFVFTLTETPFMLLRSSSSPASNASRSWRCHSLFWRGVFSRTAVWPAA
jgi:hypothetical protein